MLKWVIVSIAMMSGVGTLPCCFYLMLCFFEEQKKAQAEVLRKLNEK